MRLTGAALLVLAGALLGLAAEREVRERARRRAALGLMLERMAFEVERFKTPLPALFCQLADELEGEAARVCRRAADGLARPDRGQMGDIWVAATAALPGPERTILGPLGGVLGRYGPDEQLRALDRARAAMAAAEGEAREQLRRSGRMYIGVPMAAAAALAVLLL